MNMDKEEIFTLVHEGKFDFLFHKLVNKVFKTERIFSHSKKRSSARHVNIYIQSRGD